MTLEFHSQPKCIGSKTKAELIRTLSSIIPKHKLLFWENLSEKANNDITDDIAKNTTRKKTA
jgi:hypothetical protein